MRLLNWFRRDEETPDTREPLDVDRLLAEGLRDRTSAREAIERLKEERTLLLRQQRAVDKQFRRSTTKDIRNMDRSGPAVGPYQLSQAMQDTNTAGQDSARVEQEADIARRLQAVDDGLARLRPIARF